MAQRGIKFFREAPERRDPVIPSCIDCMEPANPGWGEDGAVFCRDCAPDHLKRPSHYLNIGADHAEDL